ncbi:MAG TPA: molybdopterin-synthase adenylyltransferase MoeB [Xanthomonadaceae bacterium]|nr:molybdopterin-synthase adenylyltransferase MoeB [Xanthomonadaceae bacterium]
MHPLEIAPEEAVARQREGAVLVDVREPAEWAGGMAAGAVPLAGSDFAARHRQHLPDRDAEILLICATGRRSLEAAQFLAAQGYRKARSVVGGSVAWMAGGLPWRSPEGFDAQTSERYSRHLLLPEVGIEGQRRLLAARVLLIGAGGLGSPAGLYLAAAGVGTLGLVDDDLVDRSNLQRQVLHTDARVGQRKIDSALATLTALNPGVRVQGFDARLSSENVDAILGEGWDLVIDGSDNFPTRYLLNDACVKHGLPLVYGAVHRFQGQVSVFHAGHGPCYRCLFPEPPPPEAAPNCAEAGVLGVLPGMVGLLQATEAIKLILGIGEPLTGRLLCIDALSMRFRELRLPRDPGCPLCAEGRVFPGYVDYQAFCAAGSGG